MISVDISSKINPLIEKIGDLSKWQRILGFIGVFVVFIGAFGYFSVYPKITRINEMQQQYEQLEQTLNSSRLKAQQLERYREKKKKAEGELKIALQKLPEKKDIPSLLASISQSGKEAGLDFILFQPESEQNKEFYAEIPVAMQVEGAYHNVAQFFDKVSQLPRIVNIRDIRMTASSKKGAQLMTSCKAVTYRFIPDSVTNKQKPSTNKQ